MITVFKNIKHIYVQSVVRPHAFHTALISFVISVISTSLHYSMTWYGNWVMWISWVVSVVALFYAFFPHVSIQRYIKTLFHRHETYITLGVIICYLFTHLIHFSSAPWNLNGLFDDAAWDIYFAKNHVFTGPFQAAYFDTVGYISREVVFHYYITIWFKIFGYNLLIFNIALLCLGGITVLYTTLVLHKLFRNIVITICGFCFINFLPLHYMHIFMGHRYAIAAPLMMISLYYLYSGYLKYSVITIVVSGFFAALCLGSSVMGKQYIIGLGAGSCIAFLFTPSLWKKKALYSLMFIWGISFILCASPLLLYILWNYSNYIIREQSLAQEFFSHVATQGIVGVTPYLEQLKEVFFAPITYRRQFLVDYYPIPFVYFILLIPGIIILCLRKRFELVFLAVIPVIGSLISGSYDFRILLAAPIWCICMSYSIWYLTRIWKQQRQYVLNRALLPMLFISIIWFGLLPSIMYIWNTSHDPHHQYLLPHKDVAISRLMQDIVLGVNHPTSTMKWNELNRRVNMESISHDTFISSATSYAILHLFLQNYDDRKILSFIDQGTQQLCTSQEALHDHINAITAYVPTPNKDLVLVWEVSPQSEAIIALFHEYASYGHEYTYEGEVDGRAFSVYSLTIDYEYISLFQHQVQLMRL